MKVPFVDFPLPCNHIVLPYEDFMAIRNEEPNPELNGQFVEIRDGEARLMCPFIHDNIDTLHGVEPMPIEELPKTCTCGAPLTYADEVTFIGFPFRTHPTPEVVLIETDLSDQLWPHRSKE